MSATGGPGGAPSRYLANNSGSEALDRAPQQAAREARWALRRGLWRVTNIPRIANCGRALTGDYTRVHMKEGAAYYCDVQTCASVWSCPVCAAVIRQRRALEIERICLEHLAAARSIGFLTLTFPHRQGEPLGDLLPLLTRCWDRLCQRRGYRAATAALSLLGFIRATEVTYGRWNGWHPHLHNLLMFDQAVSDDDLAALRDLISEAWADVVQKQGRKRPGEEVGVTLAPVTSSGVGGYLAKVQDQYGAERSIGREMQRFDAKKGRKQSRTPFELLEQAVQGVTPELPLWWEWEAATKGRRALAISTAVRERYEVDESDDEALAQAAVDGDALGTVSAAGYSLLVKARAETHFLDLAEDGGWAAAHAFLTGLEVEDDAA